MWLRRRLGCAGSARLRIVEPVRASIVAPPSTSAPTVGWTDAELNAFTQTQALGDIAAAVSGRGDSAALARIAWWGAALADLMPASSSLARQQAMAIGATFNLAVALFDTAIDQSPTVRAALVAALAPPRLHARLHHGADAAAQLHSAHPVAAQVVELFDRALLLTATRYAGRHTELAAMGPLLEAMYHSALGESDDPFIAKTGPVIFIGQVAAGRDGQALYAALAEFCKRWDDALDIAEDLITLAPNHFLGRGRGISLGATLAQVSRGALRVVAGSVAHGSIERPLRQAIQTSLAAAAALGEQTHARTVQLCYELSS